jgi:hypothetical protein
MGKICEILTTMDYGLAPESAEQGRQYLRRATQVKNIWTPYGE